MLLEPAEEGLIADQAVFDDLGQTRRQFPRRQGRQAGGVDDHGLGLVEGADHVLAQRVVDAGLAAHRGIDLGQQRGRHLDEVHPALIAGRGEPAHVADHPATKGDEGGLAIMAILQQTVEDQLQGFPVLVRLAIGQHDRANRAVAQGAQQALQIERRDGLVGDDRHLAPGEMGQEAFRLIQKALADVDRVAALTELDVKSPHAVTLIQRAPSIAQNACGFNAAPGLSDGRVSAARPAGAAARRSR